jgi:hypothetical protein
LGGRARQDDKAKREEVKMGASRRDAVRTEEKWFDGWNTWIQNSQKFKPT